jgi:hypothetical protein
MTPPGAVREGPLSSADIDAFHRDGFLAPEFRIQHRHLEAMRASADALIARNPELPPERLVNPHLAGWTNLPNPYRACALDPTLLDLVEQLLGPDIIFWGSLLLCDPTPAGLSALGRQHRDYWPIRPLKTLSVSIALDGTGEVHHSGEPVSDPGRITLHDARVDGGDRGVSLPLAGQRRPAIVFRYMPATSVFERDATLLRGRVTYPIWDTPIFLARGVDRAGRNNFQHGHSADFSA